MNSNNSYKDAIKAIKDAILISQYESVKSINEKELLLDLSVGKYISDNTRNGSWGSDALGVISEQLQKELPGLRGFSERNLRNMRIFFEEWAKYLFFPVKELNNQNSPDASDEITIINCNFKREIITNRELNLAGMPAEITLSNFKNDKFIQNFLSIGFTHHCTILSKVKNIDERIYYINKSATEHLSYRRLEEIINSDDFHHRGKLVNNFEMTIKDGRSASKALEAFTDQITLPAVVVEELNSRDIDDVDEKVLENAIVHNIKNFILTFGEGFAFIRNQYHLSVYGEDRYVDLLFYNRNLNSLIAVELKRGGFKDAYLGQMTSYLAILDETEKKEHENPSIGIILCKDMNKAYVDLVVRRSSSPIGVATYKTSNDIPSDIRKALPDIDELRKLLESSDIDKF